jgi:D-beta-D-heptose 7-phosphate kinase / D-beta-D-heptose 1-phosphate adenosyltransferase
LSEATRRRADSEEDVIAAASELNRLLRTDAVVVSLSDAGLILVPADGAALHVPAYPVKVKDASGAGDTVVAALGVMLAIKMDYEPAVRAANAAAAVVVGKRGTATASAAELRSRILSAASLAPEEKIVFDWSVLGEPLAAWRDLRIACDRLIVGLNGDASVRRLKGDGRPLQEVRARKCWRRSRRSTLSSSSIRTRRSSGSGACVPRSWPRAATTGARRWWDTNSSKAMAAK